ncbi:hypothetical protein MRB53_024895 [Persea americana]|uniref:Uncharacterized protein n=1 Tax=Persea americana TaxID=3435 RepID=A0ACC2LDJ0_PERAE|nr:hypothetical protein MRB53_024895 [Persea americana]
MIAFPAVQSERRKTRPVDDWRKSLELGKEKVSHLHFYFHHTVRGKKPSAVKVAEAQMTNQSATLFDGFTSGRCKGSSFSIMGENHVMHQVREMPIVGGTGLFRFARGVAIAKKYFFNDTTGVAIVDNVTVLHF